MRSLLRLPRAALAFLCLLGLGSIVGPAALAQTTTITASNLKIGGYPITTGDVLITAVNIWGQPIPFADGTGSQDGPSAFACKVANGAITGAITETGSVSGACIVPDVTLTTPANLIYSIQVQDQSSGLRTSGASYTLGQVGGVSGATWALDHYAPPATFSGSQTVQQAIGTAVPSTCSAPSIFTLTPTGAFYTCVGGIYIAVVGSGGGGATSFSGLTGVATPAQLPAATPAAQGAVQLPSGAAGSTLGGAAMHGPSITVSGVTCTLDGSCTVSGGSGTPPLVVDYAKAALCTGGTAFTAGLNSYATNQPSPGCVAAATSTLGYMAFAAAPVASQYAEQTVEAPQYWTGTSISLKFYSAATTGNVGWLLQTACVNDGAALGTPSFGTAVALTTTVSATANGQVTSAIATNAAVPGTNGCVAGTTAPGSLIVYRVYRAASDTAAGAANLLGVTLVTGRSQ